MARGWSGPGEYKEIVQIGAVRLDDDWKEEAALSLFVRPRINPILSDYFTNLTGITQARLDEEGMDIVPALEKFGEFIGPSLLAYSNGRDGEVVLRNCELSGLPPLSCQPRFYNVRTHLSLISGVASSELDSFRLHQTFGLETGGHTAHDALGDARGIADLLVHLHWQGKFPPEG